MIWTETLLLLFLFLGIPVGGRRNHSLFKRNHHKAAIDKGEVVRDFAMTTSIMQAIMEKGYDWRVRPTGIQLINGTMYGPVVVHVNMLIRSISKIDDVNMEYSVQITFREEWVDGRLSYGLPGDNAPSFIILAAGQQIWMPDSFFQNEKQARKHEIDKPNVLIRVHKDGRILYSVRLSLVLSCPMHLHNYPMDVQTCVIDLASYAYTIDDIEYRWAEKALQLKDEVNSSLPSFQLTEYKPDYCTSKTNTGEYSCLRVTLFLKRQFSYYLLQLYIPSSMLVIVSWVSFWLDRSAVPARVTLGVTTLLTMTTQASGINAKLPPVSYTKAIDVWIGACLTFIFGALLEFAFVTYISSKSFHKGPKDPKRSSLVIQNSHTEENNCVWIRRAEGQSLLFSAKRGAVTAVFRRCAVYRWFTDKLHIEDRAKRADLLSRILFPLCFVLFNIAYWCTY